MGKNNRPGVKNTSQVDELEEGTEDTDTDTDLLQSLEGDENADDFLEDWKPPSQLQAPPPRPGFVQHWCRMATGGNADPRQRLYNEQQGWRPRRIDTIDEADRAKYLAAQDPQYGDVITQGSLVLCEMPERKARQRNAYYRAKHDRQMDSMVTSPLAETNRSANAGFGPIKMSRTSKSVTGKRSIAMADD